MASMAFAPFLAFAVVDKTVGSVEGLVAGAVTSAALILRDWLTPDHSPKLLEIGTAALFAGLALCTLLLKPDWSILAVRLMVDGGLLAIILFTMAIRRPFTIQYAREKAPKALWDHPKFLHANYVITGVWAATFVVMVLADLVMYDMPSVPLWVSIVATVLAILAAGKYTSWYSSTKLKQQAVQPAA